MYKPLQIQAPQNRNPKNPPLNRPSEYKPPGGLVLGICPRIQRKNGKFSSHYKLAQSNLKRKFPSVDKPRGLFSDFYGSLIAKCDDCYKLRNELQIAINDGYYDKL